MMFDQSQIDGHQQTAIDQDGSTTKFDVAEAQPLLDQVEAGAAPAPVAGHHDGTMMLQDGGAPSPVQPMSPQQQELETGPGVSSPAPHMAASLPAPASSNNLIILFLIAIGSLAIVSAGVFFLLQ